MKISTQMKIVKDIALLSWSWHTSILLLCKRLDDEKLYQQSIKMQTEVILEFLSNTILRITKNNKVRKKLADYYSKEIRKMMNDNIDKYK